MKSYRLAVEPGAITRAGAHIDERQRRGTIVNTTISADVRGEGRRAAHSPAFEVLARIGFVARGVIYGTIGLLAIQVAIHSSNEKTNQRGAMQAIEKQPFGHGLLIAVAIGLGGYALWRFVQAGFGRRPGGRRRQLHHGADRGRCRAASPMRRCASSR